MISKRTVTHTYSPLSTCLTAMLLIGVLLPVATQAQDAIVGDTNAEDLIVSDQENSANPQEGNACFGQHCTPNMTFPGRNEVFIWNIWPSIEYRYGQNITTNYEMGAANGYFYLWDRVTGTVPFRIDEGAPYDSIHVDSGGFVGLGTNTPVVDLDIYNPGGATFVRQRAGVTSYWEHASFDNVYYLGNDVQNWPFVLFKGAPNYSITVDPAGNLGLGTSAPLDALHLYKADARVRIQDTNATEANRTLLQLQNNGTSIIRTVNSAGVNWDMAFRNSWYALRPNTGGDQMRVYANGRFTAGERGGGAFNLELTPGGDLNIDGNGNFGGVVNTSSSRTVKKDIKRVDSGALLDKLADLDIVKWTYKRDEGVRHIGPIAEDFYATFGVGTDDKHLSASDAAGLALAAIQALQAENAALEQRLERLEALAEPGLNDAGN